MRSHLLAVSLLLGAPLAAAAQDHQGGVFGGYSLLRSGGESLHGAEFSLAYNLSGRFGIVVDAAGHTSTVDGEDRSSSSLMAGPRVSLGRGQVAPFLHALVGAVRSKSSIRAFGVEISETSTDPGAAFGGGVDFGLGGGRWAIRAQADYRVVRINHLDEQTTESDPRFAVGAVLRFGRRP